MISSGQERGESRMSKVKLDTTEKAESVAVLSNTITDCMIHNNMTLEHLDSACDVVRGVYKENATIKKAD